MKGSGRLSRTQPKGNCQAEYPGCQGYLGLLFSAQFFPIGLLGRLIEFWNPDERQIPVFLPIIQPVTNQEFLSHFEANVVKGNVCYPPHPFVQQGAYS